MVESTPAATPTESLPSIHRFKSIGSTNTEALRLGEAGAPHNTVVIAEYQTAGRGKLERKWHMPAGQGILLSILMRDMPPGVPFLQLTLQVGYRIAAVLRERAGLDIIVKQPNDLMFEGKKLGGVLSEARWRGDEFQFAVVGIGINVNVMEFPEEIRGTATSLALAAGREFDIEELTQAVIKSLRSM